MKFHILTLFPEMIMQGLNTSIIGRAVEKKLIDINAVNIRDYTLDKHGKVDDYPYGGGAGMLMQAQPVYDAHNAVTGGKKIRTIYVTPQGYTFNQQMAMEFAKEEELVFLCGHYEGIDERVLEEVVTDYVSIGDYVLTGGELPAMVMIDAISRLVPGVLNNDISAETESFHNDLLEYPQYSRPEEWHGKRVPKELLSGNHKIISQWRMEQSKERTCERRPDLYHKYMKKEKLIKKLSKKKRNHIHMMESLARGKGEILYSEGENLLIYDRNAKLAMMTVTDSEIGEKLLGLVPDSVEYFVASQEFMCQSIMERFEFGVQHECKISCYTKKEALPVKYKDIQVLDLSHLNYVKAHYKDENEEYIADHLLRKAIYGAYAEDKLVGFVGIHADGSGGFLYVEEAHRGKGIGESLEAYCVNRQREWGFTPYAYIIADNRESMDLQERMGMYLSKDSVWWFGK